MYGTVAKIQVKAGLIETLRARMEHFSRENDPGQVGGYVFQSDADPNALIVVAVFESKDAYVANANRPETHARFLEMRSFLDRDPDWQDGEVIATFPAA